MGEGQRANAGRDTDFGGLLMLFSTAAEGGINRPPIPKYPARIFNLCFQRGQSGKTEGEKSADMESRHVLRGSAKSKLSPFDECFF